MKAACTRFQFPADFLKLCIIGCTDVSVRNHENGSGEQVKFCNIVRNEFEPTEAATG